MGTNIDILDRLQDEEGYVRLKLSNEKSLYGLPIRVIFLEDEDGWDTIKRLEFEPCCRWPNIDLSAEDIISYEHTNWTAIPLYGGELRERKREKEEQHINSESDVLDRLAGDKHFLRLNLSDGTTLYGIAHCVVLREDENGWDTVKRLEFEPCYRWRDIDLSEEDIVSYERIRRADLPLYADLTWGKK